MKRIRVLVGLSDELLAAAAVGVQHELERLCRAVIAILVIAILAFLVIILDTAVQRFDHAFARVVFVDGFQIRRRRNLHAFGRAGRKAECGEDAPAEEADALGGLEGEGAEPIRRGVLERARHCGLLCGARGFAVLRANGRAV